MHCRGLQAVVQRGTADACKLLSACRSQANGIARTSLGIQLPSLPSSFDAVPKKRRRAEDDPDAACPSAAADSGRPSSKSAPHTTTQSLLHPVQALIPPGIPCRLLFAGNVSGICCQWPYPCHLVDAALLIVRGVFYLFISSSSIGHPCDVAAVTDPDN